MNHQHKHLVECEQNLFNTRKENSQKIHVQKKCGRIQDTPGRFSCCVVPPITTTPFAMIDPCDKSVCYKENLYVPVKNKCEQPRLTGYGREFVENTGRTIKNCVCVKFNGLQDSCVHPKCYTKIGCLDIPYPTCPPARQWKCDYMCKNKNNRFDC